jgi:hypothetical protein
MLEREMAEILLIAVAGVGGNLFGIGVIQDRPRLTKPFTTVELEEQLGFLSNEIAKGRRARARRSAQ